MKLFRRIFLSFWVAMLLMAALVLTVNEFLPTAFPGTHDKHFEPEVAALALTDAVNAFEREGPASFRARAHASPVLRHTSPGLFDYRGNPLIDGHQSGSLYVALAEAVASTGNAQLHSGFRVLYACPLESASGKHYISVITVSGPSNRFWRFRFWLNLAMAILPAAIVCMILALHITRPIMKLQNAARRLAAGELKARAEPLSFVRHDEIGDLARDFDAMALQIELLMSAQRRFVADVSHELSGPLTRMHLAIALLRREFASAKSGALVRIERETDKLSQLVQQLLLMAGLEAGRIPAEAYVAVSLRSLCENIVEDANFEAAYANCRIAGVRQDFTVLVYPNLLRRAIDNVLRNAVRYAPHGTEIDLNCSANLNQREVVIEILDCGPGVPEEMLADIFTPFFRTAPGRKTSSGGTGLGLAIANEAVRLHDGTITARNREHGGLKVTMRLPLRTPMPEETSSNDTEVEAGEKESY